MLKTQKSIKLENTCNAIYDNNLLIDAMLWYADGLPLLQYKKVFLQPTYNMWYPCVSIRKQAVKIHILLIMYHLKTKNLNGKIVHHIDGNPLNSNFDNLLLVTKKEHQQIHHCGKTITPEHRQSISDTRKSDFHKYKPRPIIRADIKGESVYSLYKKGLTFFDIANILNTSKSTVRNRYIEYTLRLKNQSECFSKTDVRDNASKAEL